MEMAPFSDIDLLFLTPYKQTAWGESVNETKFYILPHTNYDEMIKERDNRILARTEPQEADMQEVLLGTLMSDKGEW